MSPGSLPFIQPIIQALSPQPSVCPFDRSFGPILNVKGLAPLWLLTAKPRHASLEILSSPAFILPGLSSSSSPSLAWPPLCQSSEMLLLLQRRRTVTTHIENQFAVAPSRGGGFAREEGNEQTQSRGRKHHPRLLQDVLRGKSRDSARRQMTNHGTPMQNCFQLLSSRRNQSNRKPPMQEQMKLHNGAFNAG